MGFWGFGVCGFDEKVIDGFSEFVLNLKIKVKNGRGFFDYKNVYLDNNKVFKFWSYFIYDANIKSYFYSFILIILFISLFLNYGSLYSIFICIPLIVIKVIYILDWYYYTYIPKNIYNKNLNNIKIEKMVNKKNIKWEKFSLNTIKIGNLFKLKKNDVCYFDSLLIESTDKKFKTKIAYINETNIRDNLILTEKEVIDLPNREFSQNESQFLNNNLNTWNANIYYEWPDKDNDNFKGSLRIHNDPKTIFIKKKNIIFKGSVIKSNEIYCMVLVDEKLKKLQNITMKKIPFYKIIEKGNYLFNIVQTKMVKFLLIFILLNYFINFVIWGQNEIFNIRVYSPPLIILFYWVFFELSQIIEYFYLKKYINMKNKFNIKETTTLNKKEGKKIESKKKIDKIIESENNQLIDLVKKEIIYKQIQINSYNKLNNLIKSNHYIVSKKVISDLNSTYIIQHLITLERAYFVDSLKDIKDIKEKKDQLDKSQEELNYSITLNDSYEEKSQEYLEEIQGNYTPHVMNEISNEYNNSYDDNSNLSDSNSFSDENKIITDISIPEIKIHYQNEESNNYLENKFDKSLNMNSEHSFDDGENSIYIDKKYDKVSDKKSSYAYSSHSITSGMTNSYKKEVDDNKKYLEFNFDSNVKVEELIIDCEKENKLIQELFECFLICNEVLFKDINDINNIDKTIIEFCNKFLIYLEFVTVNKNNEENMELKIKIKEDEFYYIVNNINHSFNNKGRLSILINTKKHNKNNILYVRGKFKLMIRHLKLTENEKLNLELYAKNLKKQNLDLWIFAKKELNEKHAFEYNEVFDNFNKNESNIQNFIDKYEKDLDFIGMISFNSLYDEEFNHLSNKIKEANSKFSIISNNNKREIYSLFYKLNFVEDNLKKNDRKSKINNFDIYNFELDSKSITDKVINDIENNNKQEGFDDKLNNILSISGNMIDKIFDGKIILDYFFFISNFFKYYIIYNCSSEQKMKYISLLKYYDIKRNYIIGIGYGLNDRLMIKECDVGFEIIKDEKDRDKSLEFVQSDAIVYDFKSISRIINIYQNFFQFNKILILEFSIIFWLFNSVYIMYLNSFFNLNNLKPDNRNRFILIFNLRIELNIFYYYIICFTFNLWNIINFIKNNYNNNTSYFEKHKKMYFIKIKKLFYFYYFEIMAIQIFNFLLLRIFFHNITNNDCYYNYTIYSLFISNFFIFIINLNNINENENSKIKNLFLILYFLSITIINYFIVNDYRSIKSNYLSLIIIIICDILLILAFEIIKIKILKFENMKELSLNKEKEEYKLINNQENVENQIKKILNQSYKNLNFLDNFSNKLLSNIEIENELENGSLLNKTTLKINNDIISFCFKIHEKKNILENNKILGIIDIFISIFIIISSKVSSINGFNIILGSIYLVFSVFNYLLSHFQIKHFYLKNCIFYFEMICILVFLFLNKSEEIDYFINSLYFIFLFKKFNFSVKYQITTMSFFFILNWLILIFYDFYFFYMYKQLILLFVIFSIIHYNYANKRLSKLVFIKTNCLRNIKNNYNDIIKILLPDYIIEELPKVKKEEGICLANYAGNLNIIFCEVSNFDELLKKEDIKAVQILDKVFRKFDYFCKEFGVQKIETVGKTYMASTGITLLEDRLEKNFTKIKPIKRIIHLAVIMQNYVKDLTNELNNEIHLRIGIHCGSCIYGIIGKRKPQFSLIGDVVNTTSRHCTKAGNGEILLSQQINDNIRFKEEDEILLKEDIPMKGKGILTVYKLDWRFIIDNKLYDFNQVLNDGEINENMHNKSFQDLFNINIIDNLFEEEDEDDEESQFIEEKNLENIKNSENEIKNNTIKKDTTKLYFSNTINEIDIKENFLKIYFSKSYENYKIYLDIKKKSPMIKKSYLIFIIIINIFQIGYFYTSISHKKSITLIFYTIFNVVIISYCILNLIKPALFEEKIKIHFGVKLILFFIFIFKFLLILNFSSYFIINSEKLTLDIRVYLLIWEIIIFKIYNEFIFEYSLFEHLINSAIVTVFMIIILVLNQSLIVFYFIIFIIYNQILVYFKIDLNRALQIKNYNLDTQLKLKDTSLSENIKEFLPKHIMDQIKKSNLIIGEKYEKVTLLFADIVGFTSFSDKNSSLRVLKMLSNLFSEFDQNCNDLELFKLYTIGDCYVTMSFYDKFKRKSIVEETKNTIKLAFKMIEHIKVISRMNDFNDLKLRIGIHNGDILSGVIGTDIVRFDIYGQNVLIANKIESNGFPNEICISEDIKNILKEDKNDEFIFKFNKTIDLSSIDKKINSYIITRKEEI